MNKVDLMREITDKFNKLPMDSKINVVGHLAGMRTVDGFIVNYNSFGENEYSIIGLFDSSILDDSDRISLLETFKQLLELGKQQDVNYIIGQINNYIRGKSKTEIKKILDEIKKDKVLLKKYFPGIVWGSGEVDLVYDRIFVDGAKIK